MYPRSSRPARPTTMFRPSAVAAKMMTWVAIDMFASEPPWVNGNRNATTKAPSMSTRRWRAARIPIQVKKPHDASAQMTRAEGDEEQQEDAAVLLTERERRAEQGQREQDDDDDDLDPARELGLDRVVDRVHPQQQPAGGQEQAADPGDPAARVDVDDPAALDRDEHQHDGHERGRAEAQRATAKDDLNQSPSACSGPRYIAGTTMATRARTSAKSWTMPGYAYTERSPRMVET